MRFKIANPQIENGHLDLANEIVEALAKIRISGEEMQCLWVIFRKTYGWHKKKDSISLSQFTLFTNIKKPRVLRLLQKLQSKNIIIIQNDNDLGNTYRFNKDFDTWIPLSKKITTFIPESSLKKFCYLCKFEDAIEKHHIIPLCNNGLDKVENKIVVCPNCHALIHKGKISRENLFAKKIEIESGIIQNDNTTETEALSKKGHTKENYTKETNTNTKEKRILQYFDTFWIAYPKKKNRGDAEKAWSKIKFQDGLLDKILTTIEKAKKSPDWKKDGGQFIPYPASWLNAKGWEDEFENPDDPYSNLEIVGAKNGNSN